MDHFLHEIEITNFKSIRHQKIEGCKRINVFIGYPNVGKSNVLEALSLIKYSDLNSLQNIHDFVRFSRYAELFFNGNVHKDALITFRLNERIALSFEAKTEVNLRHEYEDVHSFTGWKNLYSTRFKAGELPATVITASEPPEKYGTDVKKYHFDIHSERGEYGAPWLDEPFGENLFHILETHPALLKDAASLLDEYDSKLAFEKDDGILLKILKPLGNDAVFLLPFGQIADTLQRLIFYKAAIASNKDTVLLFEEPEAHMFPPYVSKFTADIIFDEGGNQFFINTHSPFVVNDFLEEKDLDLSIYVVGLKNGETTIKRLTDEELHEVYQYGIDLFFNLERYLDE